MYACILCGNDDIDKIITHHNEEQHLADNDGFINTMPKNILSKVEFSKCFEYHPFGARCFLRKNKRFFDFIILSNFLHLFELDYANELYDSCRSIITNNGYIYVKVANDTHTISEAVKWGLNQGELLAFIEPIQSIIVINNSDSSISVLFQV